MNCKTEVSFAWWVKPYLLAVALSAWLQGREPDQDRAWERVQGGIVVIRTWAWPA